jgi:hypothetical protein
MRFGDYTRATRSHTLAWPTARTQTLLLAARELLSAALPMIREQGLTMIGVAIMNLEDDQAFQMPLPFERRANPAVDAVLDKLRDRFGAAILKRASLLGRDEGLLVPLLPDSGSDYETSVPAPALGDDEVDEDVEAVSFDEPESFDVPPSDDFEVESDSLALRPFAATDDDDRESVMYQPLPLKTMPTG